MKDYQENSSKYPRFGDLSLLALRKWESFYESIDEDLKKKENNILDLLLANILFELSTSRTGGRVKLQKLSEIIGLELTVLRKRLKKLEEDFRIEINFIDRDEVVPLTEENKMQLKFEDFIIERIQEFRDLNGRLKRFFESISQRKKICENEESIKNKAKELKEKIISSQISLDKDFSEQMKNEYNKQLINDFEEIKENSIKNINSIDSIMDKRAEFGILAKKEIEKIKKKYEEIVSFTHFEKIETIEQFNAEMEEFYAMIYTFSKSSEENIKKRTKDIKSFDRYAFDLKNYYQNLAKELANDLKITSHEKFKHIKKVLVMNLGEILSSKIEDYLNEFQENLNKFENEANKLMKKKETEMLQDLIRKYHKEVNEFLKKSQDEIDNFFNTNEENYKLTRLKYKFENILDAWDINRIKESFMIYISLFA